MLRGVLEVTAKKLFQKGRTNRRTDNLDVPLVPGCMQCLPLLVIFICMVDSGFDLSFALLVQTFGHLLRILFPC